MNQPLPKALRSQLENTIKAAREEAEIAARAALERLGVSEPKVPDYLSESDRALRRRLRAHARALGDAKLSDDTQTTQRLVWEIAYEHWHRMLFARFLAENGLLLWDLDTPVTLQECEELAEDPATSLDSASGWELAGKLVARMLPQVFKTQSPVFSVKFSINEQRALEKRLANIASETFQASDSLGWVYQFWQAKRKDDINASGVKIGSDELPAVTQLFTEPYMVEFLLHNSLGAWWVTRHPTTPSPVPLTYLRTLDDGTPAAGRFEGWPDRLKDFKLLDPSCGSGHFLVAAFLMLVPMRMAEGLNAIDAVDAVLAENLFGLELDPRCVEIAVFALALAAWRYRDEDGRALGVRADMPMPHIACCGLAVSASAEEWVSLVPSTAVNATELRAGLRQLHQTFAQAPVLGSLLDPRKSQRGDLFSADFSLLKQLLSDALARETQTPQSDDAWDIALSAQGLLEAAETLDDRYHLVITNVPYLARGKQTPVLKDYCEAYFPTAKNDLANVFLERCLELSLPDGEGAVQIVMPQNWLFLGSYKKQREDLLKRVSWRLLALIGAKGFQTPMWDFNVQLLTQVNARPSDDAVMHGLDVSTAKSAQEKSENISAYKVKEVSQSCQLNNPDARIAFDEGAQEVLLSAYAAGIVGIQSADDPRYVFNFWEISLFGKVWDYMVSSPDTGGEEFSGMSYILRWDNGNGALSNQKNACIRGLDSLNKPAILINRMANLGAFRYFKGFFHQNPALVVPHDPDNLPAIWCFCSSPEFNEAVRKIDQALKVTNATLVKVPFELAYWSQVAADRYPSGLPKPYSGDPTQWLFHGHPYAATDPLQVAVARLLGYKWPAELDSDMELSEQARNWIAKSVQLAHHQDDDGIVCLAALRGEKPAHERVLSLLSEAWEQAEAGSWKNSVLDKLLADAGHAGKTLESWLQEKFFTQHCKLFNNRPFIWHIWDGHREGFSALVNYHRLDYKTLEALIYTYLGAWISDQQKAVSAGIDGAQDKLIAAEALKRSLVLILEGEQPYDIFVRWKPLEEQPIAWSPDINDGVRLNIRPFLTVPDVRKAGAGVLRDKPNIKWGVDRGRDVESAPWFHAFGGDRNNDHHLTISEKRIAREAKS